MSTWCYISLSHIKYHTNNNTDECAQSVFPVAILKGIAAAAAAAAGRLGQVDYDRLWRKAKRLQMPSVS